MPCHQCLTAGDHAGDEGGYLEPGVRALVRRQGQPLTSQGMQPRVLGQAHDGHQTQDDTRSPSSKEGDTAATVGGNLHLRGVLAFG